MPIDRLTTCRWVGGKRFDANVNRPAWADVERAIKLLDGRERNDLYLYPDDADPERFLCVGGGAGQYIVVTVHPKHGSWTLVDPEKAADPLVAIAVGGQDGEFPFNWVVDLATVLRAAASYVADGARTAALSWEPQ